MKTITDNQKNNGSRNHVDYSSVLRMGRKLPFYDRLEQFSQSMAQQTGNEDHLYMRVIESPTDRAVIAVDKRGKKHEMLMFGANNYLGLANHPHVQKEVEKAIKKYGVGIAGPPLLNGYSSLMKQLEERLSRLKKTEDTLIFSSGYNANLGLICGLCTPHDLILADEYSHASFFDGVKLAKTRCKTFEHNNLNELEKLLKEGNPEGDIFVAVEGVYSMDGDVAPLTEIIPSAKKYGAQLLIDDAHGTGVLGFNGEGTLEDQNLKWSDEVLMGTFSKALAVNGGFVSGSKEVIGYLRFMARSYMFSASLPPVTIAAVIAGIDIIESEPWRRAQLRANVLYLTRNLAKYGLAAEPRGGIIALSVPQKANIRKMAHEFNREGIFLNAIEFPAVPLHSQRFRISVSCNHTREDLDRLIETVDKIWSENELINAE